MAGKPSSLSPGIEGTKCSRKHSGTLALNLEDITTGFAHLFGGVVNYHVANDTAEAPVQSVPYSGLLKPPTFIPILRKAGQGVQKNAAGSPSTRGTVQIVQFASLIETTPSRIINAPAVNVTNSSTQKQEHISNPGRKDLGELERRIGYSFRDRSLLERALTHPTANPSKDPDGDGDRLELLGDRMLGAIITDVCYHRNPTFSSGALSNLTSAIVSNDTLAVIAVQLSLHEYMRHNMSMDRLHELEVFVAAQRENNHCYPHEKGLIIVPYDQSDINSELIAFEIPYPKDYADLLEALAGAVYLDVGRDLSKMGDIFLNLMGPCIGKYTRDLPICPLSMVQTCFENPVYETLYSLPDGKTSIALNIANQHVFKGLGTSAKAAKTAAAKYALSYGCRKKNRKRTRSDIDNGSQEIEVRNNLQDNRKMIKCARQLAKK